MSTVAPGSDGAVVPWKLSVSPRKVAGRVRTVMAPPTTSTAGASVGVGSATGASGVVPPVVAVPELAGVAAAAGAATTNAPLRAAAQAHRRWASVRLVISNLVP